MKLAYFISGHGLGHATRSIAVMEALQLRFSDIVFYVSSNAPEFLFSAAKINIALRESAFVEPGIVQASDFTLDWAATSTAVLKYREELQDAVSHYASLFAECDAILCDISVLGILVSKELSVPSFLIENFRWGWIYREIQGPDDFLKAEASWYETQYGLADYHLQTSPVCEPNVHALQIASIARKPHRQKDDVYKELGIDPTMPVILVALPGLANELSILLAKYNSSDAQILLLHPSMTQVIHSSRLLLVPTSWYFPDLISVADSVVSKLGYSALAEAKQAEANYAFMSRDWFPETHILADHARRVLNAREIKSLEELCSVLPSLSTRSTAHRSIQEARPDPFETIASLLLESL